MTSRHYPDAMRQRDTAYWHHAAACGQSDVLGTLEEWLEVMETQAAERYASDLERALRSIDATPPPVSDEAFAMAERWADTHLPPDAEPVLTRVPAPRLEVPRL